MPAPFSFLTMAHFVYILQSLVDGTYYVGATQDLDSRLRRHNQGRASYTKAKRPWVLVYSEEYADKGSALQREREIKARKNRVFLDNLVKTSRQS